MQKIYLKGIAVFAIYLNIFFVGEAKAALSLPEIERLKTVQILLGGVDHKSLWAEMREIEKSPHPKITLVVKEAQAHTYADIVREIKVYGEHKKEWLYSMVCLNMAYLQFGGDQGAVGSTTELNRLIRQKLKEYLPMDSLKKSGFFYSLD